MHDFRCMCVQETGTHPCLFTHVIAWTLSHPDEFARKGQKLLEHSMPSPSCFYFSLAPWMRDHPALWGILPSRSTAQAHFCLCARSGPALLLVLIIKQNNKKLLVLALSSACFPDETFLGQKEKQNKTTKSPPRLPLLHRCDIQMRS